MQQKLPCGFSLLANRWSRANFLLFFFLFPLENVVFVRRRELPTYGRGCVACDICWQITAFFWVFGASTRFFFFSIPPKNRQLIRKSQVTCLFLHPYCFRTYGKFSPLIGVSSNQPHWYLRRDPFQCGRFTHIIKTPIFCQVTRILEVLTSLSWWSLTTTKSYLPTCRWQLNNWLSH